MSRITRRSFLEISALTAAALTGAEWAEQAQARTRKRGMVNNRIQIAVIGTNGRGMDHVRSFVERDDVQIVAICDADRNAAEKAVAEIEKRGKPRPTIYQDIRKLLEDRDLDAVSIATPNHWHALGAIWAMQAGKDVYVEKPVSHNVLEGRRIVEAARKYRRICQTGTQSRSHRAVQEAIAYIHSGKIGKVFLSRGLCYKTRNSIGKVTAPTPVPPGVDYDLWLGPAPYKPVMRQRFHYDWHWQWDYGNGDLGNQGIHQMDIARWALNKREMPRTVMALGGRFGYIDDGETPNTQLVFMDYDDAQLIFEVRGLKTEPLRGASVGNIIYGTEGYVVMTGNYSRVLAFDNNDNKIAEFNGSGDHYGNFLDAVRSRRITDLNADIEEGHISSAMCHLGNISYLLGSPQSFSAKTQAFGDNKEAMETYLRFEQHLADNGVPMNNLQYRLGPKLEFNPKREQFKGNKEANALLTREYRKGFEVPNRV
ncbi:MAG: Gfo/Idh/MocA family oxidoreductase [Chloroherpetonaceae bacterium]|nr:Gfo/Idh/MocA family oxidoreductase [Chthonomonadaceae bacterium]MDW8209337.1 Gfo/Idh/MocA family oxidoreductase [Chloroherpetonaceae bacterium]